MNKNQNGDKGYSGRVPPAAIMSLEWELTGLAHGTVNLTLYIRDGKLVRYATGRERTYVVEKCDDE